MGQKYSFILLLVENKRVDDTLKYFIQEKRILVEQASANWKSRVWTTEKKVLFIKGPASESAWLFLGLIEALHYHVVSFCYFNKDIKSSLPPVGDRGVWGGVLLASENSIKISVK